VSGEGPVRLHLLRHADAGDPDKWQGDDAARPLSEKGVRQAETLGRHLAGVGFGTDAILSSPKLRALQTAEIVGRALGSAVTVDDRLAGSLDPRRVAAILGDAGHPKKPVLVGHDPDFSDLLAELVGAPRLSMKKGAIARVDLAEGTQAGAGVLRWLLPPDLVPDRSRPDPAKRASSDRKRRSGAGATS
jgi:phosphohistidine phosphatase